MRWRVLPSLDRLSRSRLTRAAIGTVVASASAVALGFVVNVLLARTLGAAGYGTYALALSLATVLGVVTKLGAAPALTRDLAILRADEEWLRIRYLHTRTQVATGIASILIISAGVGLLAVARTSLSADLRGTLLISALLIPFLAWEGNHEGALRGLNRVALGQIPRTMIRPGILIVGLVVAASLLDSGLTAPQAMTLHGIAALFSVAVGGIWLARLSGARVGRIGSNPQQYHQWLIAAGPFLGFELLSVLNRQIDILALGVFEQTAEVGLYRAGLTFATLTPFFLYAGVTVLQPEIARLYHQGDAETLQRLMTRATRAITALTLLTVLVFVLLGRPLLQVAYGPEFVAVYPALIVVSAGYLVAATLGMGSTALGMTGHERSMLRGLALTTLAALIASVVLTSRFGLMGAAAAHATSVIVWASYMAVKCYQRIAIRSDLWLFGQRRPGN